MKRIVLTCLCLTILVLAHSQATYYWVGGTSAVSFTASTNWNTALNGSGSSRTTAATTDILIFDGTNVGGATPITGTVTAFISSTTIGQLKLMNNAVVQFQRPTGGGGTGTLTISGSAGDDLTISSGSSLSINSASADGSVVIALPAGVTALINGAISISNTGQNRITNQTTGGFVFAGGSSFTTNITPSSAAYPFGNSSQSVANGVVFQSGASLYYLGGYSFNGSSSAFTPVEFQTGSNLYVRANIPASGLGSFFNARTFGNLYIENGATLNADGPIYKIDNLVVNPGCSLVTHTSGQTVVLGDMTVNGSFTAPLGSTNTLVLGGSAKQTISGAGTISVPSLTIADHADVVLNNNIAVNTATSVNGKLNFTNRQISGASTFTARVNTSAAGATGTLTAGSYQITGAPASISGLTGLTVSGVGIAANTVVVGFSGSGGTINLSKPIVSSGTNVALTFASDTATLVTAHPNGFDSTAGSVLVVGTKTYQAGINYIINGATATPFGVSSGFTNTHINAGTVQLNANVTTNIGATITNNLQMVNSVLTIRPLDTIRVASGVVSGSFGSTNYVATKVNTTTGDRGIFRLDNISAATLFPIGSDTKYLPATIAPANVSDFATTVFEGVTTNGTPNGTAFTATQKETVVNAVWNLDRINGAGNADITLNWQSSLEGSTFTTLPNANIGISNNNGTAWLTATGTGDNSTNTATSSFSSFGAFNVSSKPGTQTITFNALANKTYGDADFTLSAISTNNTIPITYTSSNTAVATVSGNTVHIVGAGTTTITAAQAGNSFYAPAADVMQTLTVNKVTLTITADDKTKSQGDANPVFTFTYSGFVNNESASSLITLPIAITTATTTSPVGNYPIVPSGAASGNYDFIYVNGTLTVNSPLLINQTITFNALPAKAYGDNDFDPGATSTNSSIAITYASNNPSVATIIGGNIHIVGAGTAVITASQAGDAMHNPAADVSQTLTVTKATLTIKADDKIRNQGASDPVFTFTYSGFVNGDNANNLTTLPTATTTATSGSPTGNYPIIPGGAASPNYTFVYQNGTLTVNAYMVQVITFNSLPTKTYGDADFVPGATSNSTAFPIIYTSSNTNVATIVNGNIHIVGAGSTVITASQAGDANHQPATNVVQTLTVNKANLTVAADNKSKYVGQVNPTLTITYSGFVNAETASNLTVQPAISTTATPASPVGTYPITVSGAASANYNFNYAAGVLTINPLLTQTITFNALANKTYGDADFTISATSTNNTIPITYTSSNTAVATVSGNTVHIVGAGTTTITAAQAGVIPYSAATSVTQVLTVNKAPLTVTADNKTKSQGDANPALTISYNGFVYGDNASSLLTPVTISTTATANSAAGYYPITVSGATSNNYAISFAQGVLTVLAPTGADKNNVQVIAANNHSITVRIYVTTPVIGAIRLFNLSGHYIGIKKAYLPQGFTDVAVPVTKYPSGIFIVTVAGDNLSLNTKAVLFK